MSHRMTIGCGLVLAGLLAIGLSCSQHPPRIYLPSINASAAGREAIEMYDANKDGKLTGEELDKCPGLKAAAATLDPGGQGITAEMITARIQVWQNQKVARIPVGCTVLHNGKPLEGAEVKLVPEKFLGDNMTVATGKTDPNGMTNPSIPTSGDRYDPPGVQPGFYRVEITKPGLDIPAKYNTETVLGTEVAYGRPVMTEGLRFDLKF